MCLKICFTEICLLILAVSCHKSGAVSLTGSSEYAVPGTEFTLTCDVPEEATVVQFYRRPDVTTPVVSIQVGGGQCYNTIAIPVLCTADVCSCVTSGGNLGTVFRWIIQPQTGDQGSVWFCRRTNINLPNQILDSDDYTLHLADGPSTSVALSPPDTIYTRTEGDTLPDITCTADCRPGCTFVWTRPDNTNFTVSPVLSLGQLDRSEHGTYRCTARNVVGESSIGSSVIVQYGPSTVSLTPSTVTYTPTEGQTIPTIKCSADCNRACTYSWTKDGQSYTAGSGLQLTNIQRGQTGVYRCTASNVHDNATSVDISVTVYYGPGISVALSPPDTTYTRTEGDTLPDITCTADCRPDCTFVWTRPDNTNFTVSSVLSLGQLDRSDYGKYKCIATNLVGESSTTLNIHITRQSFDISLNRNAVRNQPLRIYMHIGTINTVVELTGPYGTTGICFAPIGGVPGGCTAGLTQDLTTGVTTFSIASVSRDTDQGVWSGIHGTEQGFINITVLTIPSLDVRQPTPGSTIMLSSTPNTETLTTAVTCAYPQVLLDLVFKLQGGGSTVSVIVNLHMYLHW